jgi:uncharacterized protein (DUF1015 family)
MVPLVAPFMGERYAEQRRLGDLIAPPYDVVNPEERQKLAERDPHNVVHLILPEGDEARYENAARQLEEWRAAGVLVADDKASVTVLRQEFSTPEGARLVRTGVIGGVAVEPLSAGRVLPHERTHKGPKEDRLALLEATEAMFEALFMVAPRRTRSPRPRCREWSSQCGALRGNELRNWPTRRGGSRCTWPTGTIATRRPWHTVTSIPRRTGCRR